MTTLIEETTLGNRLLPRIMLIACGSFSPPTLMHFRMFEIARDYLELQGTHQVVGGIVSPTHDAYGKKGLVPAKHRCSMVKLALNSSKWIRPSDWETQQNEWSRTLTVLQYHQNFLNNYIKSSTDDTCDENGALPSWIPSGLRERRDHVQLRLLCGADLLESFAVPGLWADEDIEDIVGNHGLVVISRSGANPEKFIFDSDLLTKHQRNITLVTNWVSNDVSSTMIRRLISRGMSVKYLIDDLVLEYIIKNRLFNWRSHYITHESLYPTMAVYNDEYKSQVHLKGHNDNANKMDNNNAESFDSIVSNDKDESEEHEEPMDESDFAMKNILNNFTLSNKAKIFCCGEKDKLGTKLLLNRSSPGQAVRTVISECSSSSSSSKDRFREGDELKPKKMKIMPENV